MTTTALTALTAGAYLGLEPLRIELHFLLSQLNHGVSSGKILFLLALVAAVMVRVALCQSSKPVGKALPIAFVLAAGLGLAGSMAAHLHYVGTYDLPLSGTTFHGRDGHLSVNSTTHIHVSKVAIATTLDTLGLDALHARFDTGMVYRSAVPGWLAAAIGLCFVIAVGLIVWLAPNAVRRLPAKQRQACTLLWALAGCAVCKCILDGGPLAYDAVAGGLCLWLIAAGITKRRLALACVVVLAWLGAVFAIDPDLVPTLGLRFVNRAALYALIALLGVWLASHARPALSIRLSTGLTAAVVAGFVTFGWFQTVAPLRGPAGKDALQYVEHNEQVVSARRVKQTTGSVAAAYRQLGEDPLRPRAASLSPRAEGYDFGLLGEIDLLATDGDQLRIRSTPVAQFTRTEAVQGYNGPGDRMAFVWRIDGQVGPVPIGGLGQLTENERFVTYYLLDKVLRDAGVEEYILQPHMITAWSRDEVANTAGR